MTASLGDKPADPQQIIADLRRNFDEVTAQQVATAEILKVIARSPSDVQPVFDAIASSALRLFDGYAVSVVVVRGDRIESKAVAGFDEEASQSVVQLFPLPLDRESVTGRVILERAVIHVPDIAVDESDRAKVINRTAKVRALLGAPMQRDGTAIGAITVGRRHPGAFSEKQIMLLRTLADQAVIAIENARLFSETQEALQRQAATADILKVIASSPTDTQPVFEAIVLTAVRLLRCDMSFVMLCEPPVYWVAAAATPEGLFDELTLIKQPIDPSANFPSRTIVEKQALYVPDWSLIDLPEHERHIHETIGINSALYLPLMRKGECIGLLTLGGKQANIFGESEIALAESFRDQALIAIENSRLFNETGEALERQTATADILKVIASSPTDLQPVFDAIAERSNRLIGGHSTGVYLFFDGNVHLAAFTPVSSEADAVLKASFPRPIVGTPQFEFTRDGKIVQIPDVESDVIAIAKDIARARGWRSALYLPLKTEKGPIGAISVTRKEPGAFAEHHLQLLQTFADQAVIAIQNVKLFEEVQARTRELSASLDELRAAQDRLVQTEKLASLGQLTAGIAHEMKNPLNFINNFSALSAELIDEMKDALSEIHLDKNKREELDEIAQTLKTNLEKVVQHGKRADSIVKNMLQHSREGSGEHRAADINAIVDESLNLAYHGARAEKSGFSIALQRDLDPSVGMADVYPQEITRVLLNMISNRFYAATKRKTEAGDGFEPMLSAATKNLGDKVEIRIRDNGTGIPEQVREKIFNPFFTTKPSGEGTGLGLSMSHDIIVKQHGGSIDVETEPGLFTEFKIVLPRTSQR